MRGTEKKKLLYQIYDDPKLPPDGFKHPKIAVPIKPFQPKKTPETDPWLFLIGVFPKSVQEYEKEAVRHSLSHLFINLSKC